MVMVMVMVTVTVTVTVMVMVIDRVTVMFTVRILLGSQGLVRLTISALSR